jgi:hypothetical protein
VATIYDALRLLHSFGWVEWLRIGTARYLRHTRKPGVELLIRGDLSDPLSEKALGMILDRAGLDRE